MPRKARSRAYPALSLREAADAVTHLRGVLGGGAWDRQPLAEALGHRNAAGGPGARKIAALTQFGLLRRRNGRYSFTELGETLALFRDQDELGGALRQALRQPPLFAALCRRYEPEGRLPSQLHHALVRDHGITPAASGLAAEIFLRSAQYAGVVDVEGRFVATAPVTASPASPAAGPEIAAAREVREAGSPERPTRARRADEEALAPGQQRFEIALGGGRRAVLVLPASPTSRDLALLRKQLELLELQVEMPAEEGDG